MASRPPLIRIHSPRPRVGVGTARFVAGREVDGGRRTDATWRRPGTQALTPSGRASRWSYYSHRRRAGIRAVATIAVVLVAYGVLVAPDATATTVRVAAWMAIATGVWVVVEKSRRYAHRREVVAPLAETLAERLGDSRYVLDPRTWLSVPVDVHDRPTRIYLPATYSPTEAAEKALVRLVARKIGLTAPSHQLELRGERPYLETRPAPAPPSIVRFEQVRALVEASTPERPFLGLGSRNAPIHLDWTLDSPHALASQGSGAGKSATARAIAAQALHHGAQVIIVDSVKHGASHKWAKGLSGVTIHRHPATAHDALIALSAEVQRRCERDWHDCDDDAQRILLVIEESNATRRQLQSYWTTELDGKKLSPAVGAIADILCVGRQARVNVFAVGQLMTAAASGGNDARENYGIKILSRFSRNAARMLVPEIDPQPRSSRHLGRCQVCIGGVAHETQIVLFTANEAAEWATSGEQQPRDLGEQGCHDTAGRHLALVAGPADRGLVSLAEASEQLGVSKVALRNARARDIEFPAARGVRGQDKLYRLEELARWAANRERHPRGGDAS